MKPTLRWVCLALVLVPSAAVAERLQWIGDHVHGFASQGFLASTANNYLNDSKGGDFAFTEIGVNAYFPLSRHLGLGAQAFTRDLGPLGNYDLELGWAFLDWAPDPRLGLRLGAFKLPYGLYNETADVDAVRTSILLPQGIYNLQYRDFQRNSTGAAAYGVIPTPLGPLDYEVHFGWTFLEPDGSIARTLDDFGGGAWSVESVDPIPGVGTALKWDVPGTALRAGLTYQRYLDGTMSFRIAPFARVPGGDETSEWTFDRVDMDVVSLEFAPGLWTFAAEYGQWNGLLQNAQFPIPVHDERYYVQAARVLRTNLEASAYYSVYHPDRGDRSGERTSPPDGAYQDDLALSLRLDLTQRWIAKIEVHDVRGTASLATSLNPDGMERHWRYLATKLSVAF